MKSFSKIWIGISLMAIGFGIALLIIAFSISGFRQIKETKALHENYEGVTSINMDIDYRAVEIVKGTDFSIEADNLVENELLTYVEGGVWHIKENNKERINLFGLKIPLEQLFDWNNKFKITITIPEDFVAENMDIRIKAGSLDAEIINAKSCNLDVKTGKISVENLSVSEASNYHVGAGDIEINNIKVKNIDLSCDVGNIEVNGDITGESKITNNVGNVELDLIGKEEDYSYRVSSDLGNVTVGNQSYHNINNKVINNNDAKNYLNLDCNIGNITVKFK